MIGGCWGMGLKEVMGEEGSGRSYKRATRVPCDDGSALYLVCICASILLVILNYYFIKRYHWGKPGTKYVGSFCMFFCTTACESTSISK